MSRWHCRHWKPACLHAQTKALPRHVTKTMKNFAIRSRYSSFHSLNTYFFYKIRIPLQKPHEEYLAFVMNALNSMESNSPRHFEIENLRNAWSKNLEKMEIFRNLISAYERYYELALQVRYIDSDRYRSNIQYHYSTSGIVFNANGRNPCRKNKLCIIILYLKVLNIFPTSSAMIGSMR